MENSNSSVKSRCFGCFYITDYYICTTDNDSKDNRQDKSDIESEENHEQEETNSFYSTATKCIILCRMYQSVQSASGKK